VIGVVLVAVPVVILAWTAWTHRWTADDAFIDFRVVRNLRQGHGPVFNVGERVEADTSTLWIFLLAVVDLLTPFKLEWIAAALGLAGSLVGVALATFGTRRALARLGRRGLVLPLGMLVYVALRPAWDFATSGLENGLELVWLGACWWCLSGAATSKEPRRRRCGCWC
jgi:arabinofuranosyltransferase